MLSLGIYSYGLSALVFIAVFFLIIFRWRGRLASLELALAMFAGSVWAVVSAYSAYEGYVVSIWSVSIEVLRYLIWGHFLLKLLASFSEINTSWYRILERLVYGVPVLLLALLLFVSTSDVEAGRFLGFDLRTMGHLILSLLGLMLIEQLFRLGGDQRWAFKFLFLGFGGVYLFDFYMYSEALLF
ncbi:MAG: hypothetical protein OEX19_08610, partial [Gammaproteobacteria bacterium]|nr:hypothetical protein [Gammaproteobacteria bacterium]